MSPQRSYTRATMHTFVPDDCEACGQPNAVKWIPDTRIANQDGVSPDQSCGNQGCARYKKRPSKR
ncbi:hypothetical protein [Micromonospora sp. MW-13]|uniref:hypothetical protein n=1 Tax=Micromonospora sp. MW-13 TaxID=2094022 RepID=UPI000FFEECFE|nr:hypothetical protein [Micromonospora sp. MW-13]